MAALGFDVSDQNDLEVTYSSDDADFFTVNSNGKALILRHSDKVKKNSQKV